MSSRDALTEPGQSAGRGLRIAIVCSGLGRVARGYERFFHELALALLGKADVRVYAARRPREIPGATVPCFSRAALTRFGLSPERAYYWEQIGFGLSLYPHLLAFRPHVVHVSDPALTNLLLRLRRAVPGRPTLLFCNGGALSPAHYRRYDHVQLVTPGALVEATSAGIDSSRVSVVPHGVDTVRFQGLPVREEARARLALPAGPLAISVAALNAWPKRLDYLIREFGRPSAAGWTLLCLGHPTAETPALQRLAAEVGEGRVIFRTAAPEGVPEYLAAADLFLLASVSEGFGLAAVEAMAAGLPVVLRDIPSLRYLVDDEDQLDPLQEPGALTRHLEQARSEAVRRARGERNRARAVTMFDWRSVLPAYLRLYENVAARNGA